MHENTKGIIILEGADCTGKTTLARALLARCPGAHYIHLRKHRDMWLWHTAALRRAVRLAQHSLVVIDRHWVSECIYGRVYRNGSQYPQTARRVYSMLLQHCALHVLCAPEPELVVAAHRDEKGRRVEMYDDVSEVATRYRDLALGSILRDRGQYEHGRLQGDLAEQLTAFGGVAGRQGWFVYDRFCREYAGKSRSAAIDVLDALLEYQLTHTSTMAQTFLGAITGRYAANSVLLVGDRSQHPQSAAPWPFYENGGPSRFLSRALHHAAIPEERLLYVNVNDEHGNGPTIIEQLSNGRRVVFLGGAATISGLKSCSKHADVRQVAHPQHRRRFGYDVVAYARELMEEIDGQ